MEDRSAVSLDQIRYLRRKMLERGSRHPEDFPWRVCENKWHCLVAEIMLQRTRAEQVSPVFRRFAARYSEPQLYVDDSDANVFLGLGLPHRNEQFRALNAAVALHGLPTTKAGLLELPGVGDYIASAFLSLHLGIREPLIDSNIVRVYGRFFAFRTDGETRRKKWFRDLADAITPKVKHRQYNYSLIDFSRAICKPRPRCEECPIRKECRCGR